MTSINLNVQKRKTNFIVALRNTSFSTRERNTVFHMKEKDNPIDTVGLYGYITDNSGNYFVDYSGNRIILSHAVTARGLTIRKRKTNFIRWPRGN